MEINTTPWHETRSLISPQIEMLQKDGMISTKRHFLRMKALKQLRPKKGIFTTVQITLSIASSRSFTSFCLTVLDKK
jgi:hypothetical protein